MAVITEGQSHSPDFLHVPEKIERSFLEKDILSIDQFDSNSLQHLFSFVPEMKRLTPSDELSTILSGTISYLLFYEPSTRTYLSFDAAIKRLGGNTATEHATAGEAAMKLGKKFDDKIADYAQDCDLIILRHPQVGGGASAAKAAGNTPVINAGDGIGEHPTQALLDLYTIQEHTNRLDNLSVVMGGDMLNGRTVHSLLEGLSLFPKNRVYLLAPKKLRLGGKKAQEYRDNGLEIIEIDSMNDIPKSADIWYWTRVQRERMMDLDEEEYINLKNEFVVTPEVMKKFAGKKTGLMHPLPRVGEIEASVDKDPRALYFSTQAMNGMYVRMALMSLVLGKIK